MILVANSYAFYNLVSNIGREETLAYKSEALELQRQLRHLQSQYDMLTSQASNLTQGRRARVAATSSVNGQLTSIDDSISARNLEVYNQWGEHFIKVFLRYF